MATRAQEQTALNSRLQELSERLEQEELALQEQQQTITAQSETISAHCNGSGAEPSASGTRENKVKATPIPFFLEILTAANPRRSISLSTCVKKAGAFSSISEDPMLALAECHFKDTAASWLMRLEDEWKKPTTILQLQEDMVKEFVRPDEKVRAKIELMDLRIKGNMDSHIAKFKKLVEVTDIPLKEAYIFFFMSLPRKCRQEFHKKFPYGSPPVDVDMSDIYEYARTLAVAMNWTAEEKNTVSPEKNAHKSSVKDGHSSKRSKGNGSTGKLNQGKQEKKGFGRFS